MSAYSIVAIVLMCGALPLLITGMYRKQKNLVVRAGALTAVAIIMTITGLTVGN